MLITLFIITGEEDTARAISFLKKSMRPELYEVKEYKMANTPVTPFLRLGDSHEIHGILGVEYFLEHYEECFPKNMQTA